MTTTQRCILQPVTIAQTRCVISSSVSTSDKPNMMMMMMKPRAGNILIQTELQQLENVMIANALQLEAAWATPVLSRFNYDAMPCSTRAWVQWVNRFKAEPIHCRIIAFLLLIQYFLLWPWPLNFDFEHLLCIACDITKLCTKFERNRAIRGGVIAIQYLTLWPWTCVTCYGIHWWPHARLLSAVFDKIRKEKKERK